MEAEKFQSGAIVDELVQEKERIIKEMVKRLERDALADLQKKSTELRESIRNKHPEGTINKLQLLDKVIPYGDYSNHLLAKIANASLKKEVLFEVNAQVADHVKKNLTAESALKAKKNFDLICDYDKRKKEDIPNTGELYDNDLCLYLMSKTFKKSSNDAYESYYRISAEIEDWKNTKTAESEIKIASLGGGPGSDLTGSAAFISDIWPHPKKAKKWRFEIFDIMNENWQNASRQALRFGFYKHFVQNTAINDDGLVLYSPIDFKDENTVPEEKLQTFDFITVCWALNEAAYNEKFWKKVIDATPRSFIIFVEGVDDQLVKIQALAQESDRKTLFERFESPRRLIVHPKTQEAAPEPPAENPAPDAE